MLEKYAELIVKQGVNLQKGQELVITASIECFELVRAVARQAFRGRGASGADRILKIRRL